MAQTAQVHPAHISYIDDLLCGSAWRGTITFAVADRPPDDGGYARQSVEAPSAALAAAVRSVFRSIAAFTDAHVAQAPSSAATVRVFVADALAFPTSNGNARLPLGGYGFFPGDGAQAGDVWLGTEHNDALAPGSYSYRTLLHEVGHALGLKHPSDPGPFGALPARLDGAEMTVMSARTLPGDPVTQGLAVESGGFSETYMPYDVAALQQLYGANYSDHGDDRYRFDAALPTMSRTIWDGGGTDIYDFSRYPLAVSIDLSPGGFCTTGQEAQMNGALADRAPVYADGAIHNAFLFHGDWRSGIENAIGGWGDDAIIGNRLDNRLVGNFGDDTVAGVAGADTLSGGGGADRLSGGAGADRLSGGADDDALFGASAGDALFGGSGGDALAGGVGEDTLAGAAGEDTLRGGGGDDRLTGGGGADVFVADGGRDVVTDFRPGADTLDVADPAAAFAAVAGGHDAVVVDGHSVLVLVGVAAASLDLADFV